MAGTLQDEQIALAIEALTEGYTQEDLIIAINDILQDMEDTVCLIATLDANGFPNLSPKDLRAIIISFPENKVC